MPNSVAKACDLAGSQASLAKKLNISEAAVSAWVKRGWVPWRRAEQIEQLVGVPRQELIDPRLLALVTG